MNVKVAVVLLISLSIVGYDYYNLAPQRANLILAQQQANSTLKNDLDIARDAKAKIEKVKEEIQKTETLVADLLQRLPRKSQAGALLEQITTMASNKGIRFESVTPTSTVVKTADVTTKPGGPSGRVTYEEMAISLELTTNFQDVGKYLESLEQIPRLIDVVGLQLRLPAPGKPLGIKMNVKTYIYGG